MGADYIGLRGCSLQRELGDRGFLGKLKLRAYKSAIEAQVPPEQRATVKVQIHTSGREPRDLDYPGICRELAAFEAGSPECASCPLAGGRPLGCYRYVTYPIDAVGEDVVFSFFVRELDVENSIADQIWRDIVSRIPAQGTAWHTQRGPRGTLATLPRPLVHRSRRGREVDSARVLQAVFVNLDQLALVAGYARLFRELAQFIGEEMRRAPERAAALQSSRTLRELMHVGELVNRVVPYAVEGRGRVFVDA